MTVTIFLLFSSSFTCKYSEWLINEFVKWSQWIGQWTHEFHRKEFNFLNKDIYAFVLEIKEAAGELKVKDENEFSVIIN